MTVNFPLFLVYRSLTALGTGSVRRVGRCRGDAVKLRFQSQNVGRLVATCWLDAVSSMQRCANVSGSVSLEGIFFASNLLAHYLDVGCRVVAVELTEGETRTVPEMECDWSVLLLVVGGPAPPFGRNPEPVRKEPYGLRGKPISARYGSKSDQNSIFFSNRSLLHWRRVIDPLLQRLSPQFPCCCGFLFVVVSIVDACHSRS